MLLVRHFATRYVWDLSFCLVLLVCIIRYSLTLGESKTAIAFLFYELY